MTKALEIFYLTTECKSLKVSPLTLRFRRDRRQVSGFGCQETKVLNPDTSYRTTWNDECRMSSDEWWNRFRLRLRLRPDRSLSHYKI